jgi:protein-L-isoaspartate O-methyltransferase
MSSTQHARTVQQVTHSDDVQTAHHHQCPAQQPHDHSGHAQDGDHATALADLLDLDAEVLSSYLSTVTRWVGQLATTAPGTVLDVGAGTGTGSVAWARLFPTAQVVAMDRSEELLERIRSRAREQGLDDRIRTVCADLDEGWPAMPPVDLAWAASSLHELAHPEPVFDRLRDAISPGGLLAVVEMDALPKFLPDDLGIGRPGLETRLHQALEHQPHGGNSHPDWGPVLSRSGFTLLAQRTVPIDLPAPGSPSTGRYARAYLQRIRSGLEGDLAADDLAALDLLLAGDGPASLLHRDDLHVRGSRTVWVAQRP